MDGNFVTRGEYNEHNLRMEDEHKRQNNRISTLEKAFEQNNRLIVSVEKLALSMETMQKEQKDQGEKIEALESRDGDMWRAIVKQAVMLLLGGVIGYFLTQIGM